MLSRVEVRTRQGALLTLPIDYDESGYVIEEIDGLDPVKATLVSTSFANEDGEQFHSARRESRNIKMKLGLEPDYVETTVSDLRNRLYSFFMPKSEIMLRFHMDSELYVDIVATVESFTTPLFSQDPEVDISLMCFAPDFVDPNPVQFSGMSTFTNARILHEYAGTVETGVIYSIRPDRPITAFTIYHSPPDGNDRFLDFSIPLAAGDLLLINTNTGSKGVSLTRDNVVSSALYGVSPQSDWTELQPGDNYFRLFVEGAAIPFDVTYMTRYGGL